MTLELVVTRTKVATIKSQVETDWAAESPNPVSPTNVKAVDIIRDVIDVESVIVITAYEGATA